MRAITRRSSGGRSPRRSYWAQSRSTSQTLSTSPDVLQRVEEEIAKLRFDLPDTLKLKETERRVDQLADKVNALRRSREKIFRPPPTEWIKGRLNNLHQVLEQRTSRSTQLLCNLLGPIRLELVTRDIGRPFYRALTTLDALALIEEPPPAGAEGGSNSLQRWRRRELNPRPQSRERWRLRA